MKDATTQPAISLSRAMLKRNDRQVLDHVDLTVARGEIVTS